MRMSCLSQGNMGSKAKMAKLWDIFLTLYLLQNTHSMPPARENSIALKVAVVSGVVAIVIAIIQFYPWKSKEVPANAQIVFSGAVVDQNSNISIGQAKISIVGRPTPYFTEDNGNFRIAFTDSSFKSIRVRVTKDGYKPYDQSYDLPAESIIVQLTKAN